MLISPSGQGCGSSCYCRHHGGLCDGSSICRMLPPQQFSGDRNYIFETAHGSTVFGLDPPTRPTPNKHLRGIWQRCYVQKNATQRYAHSLDDHCSMWLGLVHRLIMTTPCDHNPCDDFPSCIYMIVHRTYRHNRCWEVWGCEVRGSPTRKVSHCTVHVANDRVALDASCMTCACVRACERRCATYS